MSDNTPPPRADDPVSTPTPLSDAATKDFRPKTLTPGRPAPTAQVPGYRILEVLGRGGMGIVYKAIQEKANRLVALKMILAGAHADPTEHTRFRVEAEAVAKLSHPNIVQLYEVGDTPDGFPFFSLEYVAGGTLSERFKQGPMRPADAAALIEALARAMQCAHEQGIVHRDLKPLNILLAAGGRQQAAGIGTNLDRGVTLTTSGAAATTLQAAGCVPPAVPKISDFGLAKLVESDDGLTRTGAIMGTPAYMAPEQAFGRSKEVGPAADIYALGAILYECLTGRPPFKGATVADTLEQVRTMEPITLKQFMREFPIDLETICLHCLHKDPRRRYASAEALADDLRRFQEHKPISVRPVNNVERTWRWCRRNPGWAAMIAAVAILLLVITAGSATGFVVVSAQNVEIDKKRREAEEARDDAKKKQKEADDQRLIADNASAEAKKKRREAEIARDKEIEQTKLAKSRLNDSIQAVGLFSTDAKTFCDDALVPGDSRVKLYQVLTDQLEKQAQSQEAGEATPDALFNRVWMYQNLAQVWGSLGNADKAIAYYKKGLEAADEWLRLEPDNAHALSHRAALNFSLAGVWNSLGQYAGADLKYAEALKARRQLLNNPQVDQFTPGKSMTNLADSLEALGRFEESLTLRERVHDLYVERKLPTFVPLDNWSLTCQKAGEHVKDFDGRKALLTKAGELAEKALFQRPGSRVTLARAAKISRTLGQLEYDHGKLAEKANQVDDADAHFTEAHWHFANLASLAKRLATSHDLVERIRDYSSSFYMLGLIERQRGRLDKARENFQICLHIREQCLRDYKGDLFESAMQYDLLFALVAVGNHERAATLANEKIAKGRADSHNLYRLACIYSLCIPAVEEVRRPKALTPEDKKLQDDYRTKALSCLDLAFAGGYTDFHHVRIDADLAPIRDDPRFHEILARPEKKK